MNHSRMLNISLVAAAVAALSSGFGAPAANAAPASVMVPITHVYSPKGFDTNDNTQVVVSGYLPNLCYKAPHSEVAVDGRTIRITIKAIWDANATFCPQMVVPFLETVSTGVLDKGAYQVVVNGGSAYESHSEIAVAESTSAAVDNYVYASLDFAVREAGTRKVTLKGYNPSDCYIFDRVEFISNGKDTYSVLPIMRQVRPDCPMKMVPISIDTEVPNTLNADKVLLHVRIMDGKSINTLFDNRE
jgi:hypothetical protein